MKTKAFLFDLGGVYFEDGTDKFLKILSNKTYKSYQELYPIFREGKSIEYRENKISGNEFFNWAAKTLNVNIKAEELNNLWVRQYTEIPGVKDAVIKLKNKGYIVAVLSDNVPERVDYLQRKYNFLKLFDDAVFSYDVNLTKSSTEIFKLALSRIDVEPEAAIFIDDRNKNFIAADKVGIKTILFTSVKQLRSDLRQFIK